MQDNNNSILPLSIIWDHKMNIKCFFSFLCVMCWIYLSYRSLLLFLLSFPLQHTVLIILRQCIYEKKKKSFLADILKHSSTVILILLHLQCGYSHDVPHSSERTQLKLSDLFFHALLQHLSFTVIQEDWTYVISWDFSNVHIWEWVL